MRYQHNLYTGSTEQVAASEQRHQQTFVHVIHHSLIQTSISHYSIYCLRPPLGGGAISSEVRDSDYSHIHVQRNSCGFDERQV